MKTSVCAIMTGILNVRREEICNLEFLWESFSENLKIKMNSWNLERHAGS